MHAADGSGAPRSPSAARLLGDRYQHLLTWFELLRLLEEDSPYAYARVENTEAAGADDVTLHAVPGRGVPSRFLQVRFHTDQAPRYTPETLISARRAVLPRLLAAWRRHRPSGPLEVHLLTNGGADDALGRFLDDDGRLRSAFFAAAGEAVRARWSEALGSDGAEIVAFARDLRLQLGSGGREERRDLLRARLAAHGLRTDDDALRHMVDLVHGWITDPPGDGRLTADVLRTAIEDAGLRAAPADAPRVRLWIHGWERRRWDEPPTREIDWTRHFDWATRRIPPEETWLGFRRRLLRERRALDRLPGGAYVDLRMRAPLSLAVLVGSVFSETYGAALRVEQPTGTLAQLWDSRAVPTDRVFARVAEAGGAGEEQLLSLGVTGSGWRDAEAFFVAGAGRFHGLLHAEPAGGAGPRSVRSAGDATALAGSAKTLLRTLRDERGARRVHLLLFCPAAVALFLGQRLNAVGPVVLYERTVEGGYQRAFPLSTG